MKTLMSFFIALFLYQFCISNNNNQINIIHNKEISNFSNSLSNNYKIQKKKDSIQNIVINTIYNLTEIKSYFHKVDSIFKGKMHAKIIIFSNPTKAEPYYWVQVGIDNGLRFDTEYNFYIYVKKNIEVKYYDAFNDKIITLEEWRKSSLKIK